MINQVVSNPFLPKSKVLNEEECFQVEYQRLMRSLAGSIERELNLHAELRRLKDNVIAMALQLNTALKVAQDDEVIIETLRKEATDSRTEAISAKKQAEVANGMIVSLKLEVNVLKKKLGDMQAIDMPGQQGNFHHTNATKSTTSLSSSMGGLSSSNTSVSGQGPSSGTSLGLISDHEVDDMFAREDVMLLPSHGISADIDNLTAFQVWKMKNYAYTADTPSGSEFHDDNAVERLEELILKESMEEFKNIPRSRKYTKSSVTRMKKLDAEKNTTSMSYCFSPLPKPNKKSQVSFELSYEEKPSRPTTGASQYED